MNSYEDIINLDRPKSKYPSMDLKKRGAIFSPFEALTGYEEQIDVVSKYRETRKVLDEEQKNSINIILNNIAKDKSYKIEYYDNIERKYKVIISKIKKINNFNKSILLDNNLIINFDDLYNIDIAL